LGVDEEVEVDVCVVVPEAGDVYLMCSDGLTNEVADDEVAEVLGSGASVQGMVDELLTLALEYGAPDNVSLVLLAIDGVSDGPLQLEEDTNPRATTGAIDGADQEPGTWLQPPARIED